MKSNLMYIGDQTLLTIALLFMFIQLNAQCHKAYVPNEGDNTVSVIDIANYLLLKNINVGPRLWISMSSKKKMMTGLTRSLVKNLNFLKELIEAGQLKIVIDRCYPMEKVADAHQYNVNYILDFSKLKNRDLQLQLHPVDMHSAVDVVLTLTEPIIQHVDLTLISIMGFSRKQRPRKRRH